MAALVYILAAFLGVVLGIAGTMAWYWAGIQFWRRVRRGELGVMVVKKNNPNFYEAARILAAGADKAAKKERLLKIVRSKKDE